MILTVTNLRPDWNAWSAIGTIGAVLVALFWEPLRRQWNAPRLQIDWRHRDSYRVGSLAHSGRPRTTMHARILIRNKGREAAHRVEVVLADVYRYQEASAINDLLKLSDSYELVNGFISTPLRWTHSDQSIAEYLPQGVKLCD